MPRGRGERTYAPPNPRRRRRRPPRTGPTFPPTPTLSGTAASPVGRASPFRVAPDPVGVQGRFVRLRLSRDRTRPWHGVADAFLPWHQYRGTVGPWARLDGMARLDGRWFFPDLRGMSVRCRTRNSTLTPPRWRLAYPSGSLRCPGRSG